MDHEKRKLRQEKRDLKRAGQKRVRQTLKRALARDPDEAPFIEVDFGRYRSDELNGLDCDATRRRSEPETEPGP
jgi:hypothetical protein